MRHFEGLYYDAQGVHQSHLRAKRSVTQENAVHLQFRSHGRPFHLRLRRDLETFHSNVEIQDGLGQPQDVDLSHIYTGRILGEHQIRCVSSSHLVGVNVALIDLQFVSLGEPGSQVFGSLSDGIFHGKIMSPRDGDFYVEKAHYYFPKGANSSFHSVIYHAKDVEDPYADRRTG